MFTRAASLLKEVHCHRTLVCSLTVAAPRIHKCSKCTAAFATKYRLEKHAANHTADGATCATAVPQSVEVTQENNENHVHVALLNADALKLLNAAGELPFKSQPGFDMLEL
jgi:hypothetical protein